MPELRPLLMSRWPNVAGLLGCTGLLIYAYYLQYWEGLEPCPLCIFQRIAFFALGLSFLSAAIHHPASRFLNGFYATLISLVSLIGVALALRHLYLQSLPPEAIPVCGPDLAFMLENFPLSKILTTVLRGSGSCAVIDWTLLGLSIPGWALIWFLVLGVGGTVANVVRILPSLKQ